jgi:hypothetical protein
MATNKKATTKKQTVVKTNDVETVVVSKKQESKKPTWEIKDRLYILKGNKTPLTYTLQSKHSVKYPMLWFDEETGEQKELRYATNQNSIFRDEQKGESTLGHIVFRNGTLVVPKQKQNLQKLLSLYHPHLNNKYYEYDAIEEAEDELDDIELQLEAMVIAKEMDIDEAEAILRVELGSKVSSMTSKEIKRDLLLFSKRNPELFLELASDENVHLRNVAVKALEVRLLKLSGDQRTVYWGQNDRKLMNVPFDENPHSAIAAWFKTDEGMDVFRTIEKNLK